MSSLLRFGVELKCARLKMRSRVIFQSFEVGGGFFKLLHPRLKPPVANLIEKRTVYVSIHTELY